MDVPARLALSAGYGGGGNRTRVVSPHEPQSTAESESEPRFSYWRVWIEDDTVRVARDWLNAPPPFPQLQPMHLTLDGERVVWRPHKEGGDIASIPLSAFTAWLDQGGAHHTRPKDASQ